VLLALVACSHLHSVLHSVLQCQSLLWLGNMNQQAAVMDASVLRGKRLSTAIVLVVVCVAVATGCSDSPEGAGSLPPPGQW